MTTAQQIAWWAFILAYAGFMSFDAWRTTRRTTQALREHSRRLNDLLEEARVSCQGTIDRTRERCEAELRRARGEA